MVSWVYAWWLPQIKVTVNRKGQDAINRVKTGNTATLHFCDWNDLRQPQLTLLIIDTELTAKRQNSDIDNSPSRICWGSGDLALEQFYWFLKEFSQNLWLKGCVKSELPFRAIQSVSCTFFLQEFRVCLHVSLLDFLRGFYKYYTAYKMFWFVALLL